jgi:phosphoribosylformimino-5-aminoimidazole carboxamide ribotide isomerase
MTHGWQKSSGKSLWSLLKTFNQENFDNFLVTDISKDGTMIGPNIELYSNCIEYSPESRFTASGGISNISDVIELSDVGLNSTVTGKALLENTITAEEIKQFLRDE